MKKLTIIALIAFTFCITATANAFYGGINYMHTTADFAGLADADMGVLTLKGGHELNDYIAVEARAGIGITDDDLVPGVTMETDYVWGIYARPGIKAGNANFYGLLGYAGVEGTMTVAGDPAASGSEDEMDFSYGAGVEVNVTDKMGISFEYMVLPEFDIVPGLAVEIDSINVGMSFKF